ncbi:MAG: hypothetical protein VXW38_08255 [Bacteroidota bacterium]|nr:hypothetical protein [Bacteroidota bacterium]
MILYALILFVALFVLGLLFVPIQIYIDTDAAQYFFRLKGLLKFSLEPDEKEIIRARMRFLWKDRSFYPLARSLKPKKQPDKKKQKSSRRKFGIWKIFRVLKSFEVREFICDLDTGDYIINAKMYPVFTFLNRYRGHFNINFQDRNHLLVDLRNRPIWIIKAIV